MDLLSICDLNRMNNQDVEYLKEYFGDCLLSKNKVIERCKRIGKKLDREKTKRYFQEFTSQTSDQEKSGLTIGLPDICKVLYWLRDGVKYYSVRD